MPDSKFREQWKEDNPDLWEEMCSENLYEAESYLDWYLLGKMHQRQESTS
jgi:hypothetical protein